MAKNQTAFQLALLGPWLLCSVGLRSRQAEEAHPTSGHGTLLLQVPWPAVLPRLCAFSYRAFIAHIQSQRSCR